MSGIVKLCHSFLLNFSIIALFLLPALSTKCEGQAFAENLRYPLVVGGGQVTEMSKALGSTLRGPSYFADWDCNDYVTAEAKFESLSNRPNKASPYSINETQVNGELQEHVTIGRVKPFIAEIYGTGWMTDKDPSSNVGSAITVTMGGAVGGEVRIYRGTSVRASYEFTRWPPVYTYPGGYSRVLGISITERFNFVSRDIIR
jgi:hypothetical protein